jgi:hypothetical protein
VSTAEAPAREERAAGREPSPFVVLYALWGGLAWWALHLWATTSLVGTACAHGVTWVMNLLTVVMALGALGAVVAAVHMGRSVSPTAAANGRTRMLSVLALIIDVASVALIVLEGIPTLVISPCKVA